MPNKIEGDIWYWYHNRSEPYYHIQLTIKYRKGLLNGRTERIILEVTKGFKERYAARMSDTVFDKITYISLNYETEDALCFWHGVIRTRVVFWYCL